MLSIYLRHMILSILAIVLVSAALVENIRILIDTTVVKTALIHRTLIENGLVERAALIQTVVSDLSLISTRGQQNRIKRSNSILALSVWRHHEMLSDFFATC